MQATAACMRLPRWSPKNISSHHAPTSSNYDGGRYAVPHVVLIGPSSRSKFPSGLVVSKTRSGERNTLSFYGSTQIANNANKATKQNMPRYTTDVTANFSPWIETMKLYVFMSMDSDILGAQILGLLSAAWAPSTAITYVTILSAGTSTSATNTC
jgi:hypothetical protein